jgi:hypothetical protein
MHGNIINWCWSRLKLNPGEINSCLGGDSNPSRRHAQLQCLPTDLMPVLPLHTYCIHTLFFSFELLSDATLRSTACLCSFGMGCCNYKLWINWGRQCFVMTKRLIIKDARQVQGNHTEIIIRLASQTRVPLTPPHTHTNWTNAAAAASNEKACSKGKGDQGRRAPKQRREIKGVKSS